MSEQGQYRARAARVAAKLGLTSKGRSVNLVNEKHHMAKLNKARAGVGMPPLKKAGGGGMGGKQRHKPAGSPAGGQFMGK